MVRTAIERVSLRIEPPFPMQTKSLRMAMVSHSRQWMAMTALIVLERWKYPGWKYRATAGLIFHYSIFCTLFVHTANLQNISKTQKQGAPLFKSALLASGTRIMGSKRAALGLFVALDMWWLLAADVCITVVRGRALVVGRREALLVAGAPMLLLAIDTSASLMISDVPAPPLTRCAGQHTMTICPHPVTSVFQCLQFFGNMLCPILS